MGSRRDLARRGRPDLTAAWPPATDGRAGPGRQDQQGRQGIAAAHPVAAATDPDDDLEEDREHQEAGQPGRDQPTPAGGQVTAAAHHPHQPPPNPSTDQHHQRPGIGPGLEPVGGVLDQQHQPGHGDHTADRGQHLPQPAGRGQAEPQQAQTWDDHEDRPGDPSQLQLEGLAEQDREPEQHQQPAQRRLPANPPPSSVVSHGRLLY
jgi:hypothetical protein